MPNTSSFFIFSSSLLRAVKKRNNSEPIIKNNYSINNTMITTTKTTCLTLGMLAIGGLMTISALTATRPTTTTTAAFADSNAISRVERIFAALMGHQPVQTGRPAA